MDGVWKSRALVGGVIFFAHVIVGGSVPALAEAIPPHLALMAASLFENAQASLEKEPEDEGRALAIKEARSVLKKSGIARWETGSVSVRDPSAAIQSALNLPDVTTTDIADLAVLAGPLSSEKAHDVIAEVLVMKCVVYG